MTTQEDSLEYMAQQLTKGWSERVEYSVRVQVHDDACQTIQLDMTVPQLRHMTCVCPETLEKRAEMRHQLPLLTQLVESMYHVPVGGDKSGGNGGGGKPSSKPPGNLVRPELLLWSVSTIAVQALTEWTGRIVEKATITDIGANVSALLTASTRRTRDEVDDITHRLRRVVRQIRSQLGYESAHKFFAQTVCSNCGGALRVDIDRPTEVRCAGTPSSKPCGETYPWHTWGELLAAGPVLADTDTACACINRKRGTLYYWASKGYVTRYGGSGRGEARWDLDELRKYAEGVDKRRRVVQDEL